MASTKRGRPKTDELDEAQKVLLGVRVPADFHGRVLTECARRGMSLQALVTAALQHYFSFKTPARTTKSVEMQEWLEARQTLLQVWEDYLDKMPMFRIGYMFSGMTNDLVHGIDAKPSKKETKLLKAYASRLQKYERVSFARPTPDPERERQKALWLDPKSPNPWITPSTPPKEEQDRSLTERDQADSKKSEENALAKSEGRKTGKGGRRGTKAST